MESTATTTMAANVTASVSPVSSMTSRTSPVVDTGQLTKSPIKGQTLNFSMKSPSQPKEMGKEIASALLAGRQTKASHDTDSVTSSLSDVENFTGKIVYNPDGSAYIIEGPESEGSDVEAEISQEGSIIDARGMTPPYGRSNVVFPQIVSAFHISRSSAAALYSALYGQAYQNILQENKVPEVPVMHSYRVFTLRDNNKTGIDLSGDPLDTDNNNTIRANAVNYSESSAANSASSCQTVPVKPILMCFICKLSFGYTKSFIAHSIQEHGINLNEEEKRVLTSKNTSAIIQGVGKDKQPLLSFLEPKPRAPTLTELPAQFQQQLEAQQRLLASVAAAAALRQSSCSSSLSAASADNKSPVQSTGGCNTSSNAGAATLVSSVTSPVTSTLDIKQCESQSHSSALSFVLPKNSDDRQNEPSDTMPTSRETPEADSSFGPELADLANLEKIAKAAAAAVQQQQLEQMSQLAAQHANLSQRSPSPSKQLAPSPKSPIASTTPSLSQYHSSPSPTNASPFMCSAHPDGGHMTMMHSRNSCKTLKCPKCNWHYKYQETLEIHMKEKHPENEMNCIYCLANQPHPRLARGETYTCGYKPYRCEVCNYSTTTKGNLSIHMQSDKHINNVQELQNGNIPAEHLLQSQALAAAVAASATGVQSTTSSVPTTTSASAITTSPAPSAPVAEKPKPPVVSSGAGTPTSSQSKQKATWRCDVCNYETNVARNLRIHMTSEKHTHNLMVLKQNVSHMQQLSALQQAGMITPEQLFQFHPGIFAAAAGLAGQQGGPADNLQPEAALADMAYNHALLMMASQQQQQRAMAAMMQQQQQQSQPTTPGSKSPVGRLNAVPQPTYDIEHPDPSLGLHNVPYDDTCRLFQCCVCGIYSSDSIEGLSQHIQCDRTRQREDEVLMAVGGSYICKLCSYKTNLKANFQLHCKTDKHLQRLQHVNHIKEGGTQSEWKLKYVNVSNPVQVRCNVCDYYTNSIHKLQLHTANARHDACSRVFLHLQLAETLVNGAPNKYYYCALCRHPSRTKISLVQHINSIKHLRNESLRQLKQQQSGALGMKDAEEEIRDLFQVKELSPNEKIVFESDNISNDDISDSPPLGSVIEAANESMLKNALMEQQAVVAQMAAKLSQESTSAEQMHFCPYCNYSHTSEVRIQMHIVSTHSKQSAHSTSPPAAAEQTMLCPLCQEGFKEKARLETHLIEVHNVKQEGLPKLMLLVESMVTEVTPNAKAANARHHSPNWSQNDDSLDSKSEQREVDNKSDCSGDSGSKICEDELYDSGALSEILQCPGCPKIFLNLDELFTHINSEGHLKLTEVSPNSRTGTLGNSNSGYQCWKKSCGQIFKTISATQLHYKEQHAFKLGKISGAAVSDRHVYKYRCSQCSLAFKTIEKLQLHSQYHLIRAATQCVLCGRSFRSVEALQKHVESSHTEMSEEELEQYKSSLVNNPLLFSGRNGGGILDPSTTELLKKESNRLDDIGNEDEAMDLVLSNVNAGDDADEEMTDLSDNREGVVTGANPQSDSLEDFLNSQAVAEDGYNDPNRKYKCHRCKVAFTRQSYLTSHNKTLLHRKGEKLSYPMEKYLDPNRPYKCDICKESFTQKNILLVHYNSVSHLHKLKQTMKENSNQTSNQNQNSLAVTPTVGSSAVNPSAGHPSPITDSSQSSPNDMEKKPYRCNICKVAYNLGTTLDIHVRSVLHQTRASKLHDLALTGQIDLSVPLIERPDNTSETAVTAATPTTPNSSIPSAIATTSPPKMAGDQNKPSPGTPSPSTTPKFQDMLSLNLSDSQQMQQAAALQQAALNLAMSAGNNGHNLLLGSSPFQCQRCGSAFISHEAQVQHQQLCCLFSPPNNSSKQQSINQQRSQSPSAEQQSLAQTSQSALNRLPKFASYAPVCRSKPPLYKHLLETWGFEIVMQFNECHQKRVKKEPNQSDKDKDVKKESISDTNSNPNDTKDNTSAQESENKTQTEPKEAEPKKEEVKNNLPEINRSKCDRCGKEFSSIWVLKAHKEEIHKDVVPLEVVEVFADDYRTEYERKCALEDDNEGSTDQMTANTNESSQTAAGANVGQSNTPPLSMANNLVNNSSSASQADMAAANQMAAHLQFSQLLMSMGLAGMGMPLGMNMNAMNMNMPFAAAAAMGLHPPLIPVMMAPHLDPMMAAAFNHPAAAAAMVNQNAQANPSTPNPMPSPDPNFFAAQQKLMQQQQQQLNAAQQQKRARTRISDEQLKVLRQYFDINNSPTEEQLVEMSEKSGLPMKVIKHWFRNTLFKERQRNKDSPYNFNNPPSTFINLEEYEKTGETKVLTLNEIKKEVESKDIINESETEKWTANSAPDLKSSSSTKDTDYATSDDDMHEAKKKDVASNQKVEQQIQEKFENHILQLQKQQQRQLEQQIQLQQQQQQQEFELTKAMLNTSANSPHTSESSMSSQSAAENSAASLFAGLPGFATSLAPPLGSGPLQMALDAHRSQMSGGNSGATRNQDQNSNSGGSSGKRANRTRFTDYQIKVLQEFFESNAYPKDDDLEYLSKLLNLSPRVIVVWFQNARQKARKVYENQPPVPQEDDGSGRFQRTPGLNYQCKKCMQVFQRYYELIKHQKSACFKDENPLAAQIRAAAESRAQSTSPGVSREAPSTTPTPMDNGRTSATPDKLSQQSPQPTPTTPSGPSSQQQSAYRCDKCSLVFNRYDLWREHQLVHLMNPNLFPNYPPSSPFGILQYEAQQSPQTASNSNANTSASPPNAMNALSASLQHSSQQQPIKRKLPEDEDSHDYDSMSGAGTQSEQPRDKRLRTTILPEQLDYLYQKYQIESNPSRKMLESIAKEVGLKKRVVQVWFQNTRARERKGQFRAHQQVIHKRCPFCRALFKARSALESHLATRHADQYTKGDINIDALPDGDPSEINDASSPPNSNDAMRSQNMSGLTAEAVKKYYEDSLKKYLEEFNLPSKDGTGGSIPSDLSLKMKAAFEASGLTGESAPLDLSKPVDLSQPLRFSANDDENFDDTRSDGEESDSSDDGEFDFYYSHESNPTSPAPGSTTSSTTSAMRRDLGSGPNTPSNANKRFRTQMTTVMLKVMKSIFADYKTPSMAECETLGREIGLPKRVVQVWFQNARAKEKKAKLAFAKTFGQELDTNTKPIEECKICGIKYNLKFSSTAMQDHLFSKKHIENLKLHIDSVKKLIEGQDDNSADFPIASGIVLPVIPPTGQNNTNNSEPNENRSKSAANLMQQLQLMGLSGALPAGLQMPDVTVNGGNPKNINDLSKSSADKRATNAMTNNKDSNSSAAISGGPDSTSDQANLFNYMYPGLQNYYANAGAAAAFLPPNMYGTANSTGRNKI